MSLQKKMAHATLWSIIEKGGMQFVSFFVFLVVARIVGPVDYGIAMLCFSYLAFANLLIVDLGDGIVAQGINDQRDLSTLFWFIIAVGIFISFVFFLGTDILASALGTPQISPLLHLLSAAPLLLAGNVVPNMLVVQRMEFRIFAVRALVAAIGSGVVGITMAFYGFGAYALIAQQIALFALNNIILWTSIKWRPSLVFNSERLGTLVRPGIHMVGSTIATFFSEQAPRLLIGRSLGARDVGYYAFADRMRFAAQEIIIMPSFMTLYPALAEMKDDMLQQKELIKQMTFLAGALVLPALALASLTAPLYVPLLFGPQWTEATPILQVFIMLGATAPFVNIARIICRAHERIGAFAWLQAIVSCSIILVVYILAPLGLLVTGWGVFVVNLCGIPLYFHFLRRWLDFDLWSIIWQTKASLLATSAMSGLVYAFMAWTNARGWIMLFGVLGLGALIYVGISLFLQRDRIISVIYFIKEIADSKSGRPGPESIT